MLLFPKLQKLMHGKEFLDLDGTCGCDALYRGLENACSKEKNICVKDYFSDPMCQQAVTCFLNKYRRFVETALLCYDEKRHTHDFYIMLRIGRGTRESGGYKSLQNCYDEEYFLTDCGGYDVFQKSGGTRVEGRLMQLFGLLLPGPGQRILDVGCGRGELSYLLSQSGAEVCGIDYSRDAVQIAKRTYDGLEVKGKLEFCHLDVMELPAEEQYDRIVMADVVEHIEQEFLQKALCKLRACLKKDGYLLIHTAPNRNYYDVFYQERRHAARALGAFLPENPRSYYEDLMHINEQTPESLKAALLEHFPCTHVWCGTKIELDATENKEQADRETSIFAMAANEKDAYKMVLKKYMEKPCPEKAGVKIKLQETSLELVPGTTVQATAFVLNLGEERLSSCQKYGVYLCYHILSEAGETLMFDGIRTALPAAGIFPGEEKEVQTDIYVPKEFSCGRKVRLQVTMVAEGCFWFDLLSKEYMAEIEGLLR